MTSFLKKYKWPLAISLAAFLIRVIYLVQYRSNPSFYFPMVDELWHFNWAREIITSSFWGNEAYFRGPLYPYFLAFLLKITGSSIFWSRLLQEIVPSLSAALVFLIGNRLFSKKIGIIAGFGFALYGTMIFYDAMFLLEVLFVFLVLLAVYLMIISQSDIDWRKWLLIGFIMGLAAITRPNILLIVPLFMIWIYWSFKEIKGFARKMILPLILAIGTVVAIFPVTLRNYLVTGEAILISSQGGVNFYIGNNPDAEGLTMLMPEVKLDESLPWTEFNAATRAAAEKEAGKKLTVGQESSFWTKKAEHFIFSQPGKFISLTFKKLIYLFLGFENSDNGDIYFSRNFSSLFSILLWHKLIYFPFGLIFPLAVVGMVEGWKRRRDLALLYIFVIGYVPTVILFLVTARHRLPLIPFLLLFAALGAVGIWEHWKKKEKRRVAFYGAIFLVFLVLSNRTYFDIGFQNEAQIHFNLALSYERQGNLPEAEKEYKLALENNPLSATVLNNLGYVQFRQGKLNDAMASYDRAIQADPKYAETYNNMGMLYEMRQDFAGAEQAYKKAVNLDPQLYQAFLNLGDVYLEQNEYIKAEVAYLQARETAPKNKEPYFKLGALYGRKQEYQKAEEAFRTGNMLGQPSAFDYVNWGNIYYATGQAAKAISFYKSALQNDSTFLQAYYNLGLAFQRFNYPADSAKLYLNKALRINPQYEPAKRLMEQIK
ncbi:conserved membrane hypothetical protein [Candidatus Zixiibacteriota bacterium]|nr:conserved membrane hypothetical protein [candidate division Zixibacteria bacterium]